MNIKKYRKYLNKHCDTGKGWKPLVIILCDIIIRIDDTVEVLQVKEKFGGLRFYISGGNDEVDKLIDIAEEESFKTCENCGTKENVTTKGAWLKTLCSKCRTRVRIR